MYYSVRYSRKSGPRARDAPTPSRSRSTTRARPITARACRVRKPARCARSRPCAVLRIRPLERISVREYPRPRACQRLSVPVLAGALMPPHPGPRVSASAPECTSAYARARRRVPASRQRRRALCRRAPPRPPTRRCAPVRRMSSRARPCGSVRARESASAPPSDRAGSSEYAQPRVAAREYERESARASARENQRVSGRGC